MSDKLTGQALEDALAERGLPSEGSADDKRAAVAQFDAEEAATSQPDHEVAEVTTLDSDVTKPSVTAPGDGPADTTDPKERAQSAPPNPGPEAFAAGTVNAVIPLQTVAKPEGPPPRFEEFTAPRPDGAIVKVRRNIESGESIVIGVVTEAPAESGA
ncbi:hypothetical protein [Rhodococcoides fascians]|uniref:hypothetical protein n=1 Tax=Rhodococcoides fascians TaxID=1828 RepID=UPI000AE2B3CE|nr:hypothetical protein [Rhodococcus fascians]